MKVQKNFSFSEFMAFSESLVDTLDAVASKIEEVTNQIETLETVLEGDESGESVSAEANVEEPETTEVDVTTTEEVPSDTPEVPTAEDTPIETTDEENDAAAIDAMSTEDENFSNKFMVVGLINRPWGNKVIAAKEFSEKEHRKLIPTLFTTQAQAQRALTSYNVNGENFSIRYNHVNNINNTGSRYETVKGIFNM